MKDNLLQMLRKNTVFWSRMGFTYDPPIYDDDGNIMLISKETEKYAKYHDQFADVGIDVHSHIVHSGWVGVDKYDYSLCDSTLDNVFSSGKVKYLIPRVKLNVPPEWCEKNPEDTFVYFDGPRDVQSIKALCGTPKHDWLGYEAPDGYYNAGAWKDTRPNVGGLISLQSFSSEKWLSDAGKALEGFIKHIENGKYADRIVAYHIAYGACGESMLWGRNSGKFGDYGINNMKSFVSWGARKYGGADAAYKAWGISGNDEPVPPPSLRENPCPDTPEKLFKSTGNDRWSLDYDMFMNYVNVHALEVLSSVAKRASGGKPVGTFYGYVLHMERCAYTGHLAWDELLQVPDLDFFAAPKSYFRSGAGEPGGEMAPAATINRKKLWMDECDIRTHLAGGDTLAKHLEIAESVSQTKTVMLREMCKNISHDSTMWYMDLGGGWYDDKELLDYMKHLVSAKKRLDQKTHESTAQIVAVVDEKCIMYNACPEFNKTIEKALRNLQLCGAEIDVVLSSDVENHDFKNTKLVVMLNGYKMDTEYVKDLKSRLCENCHIMWINAGGITGQTLSLSRSSEVTGFDIRLAQTSFPEFEIAGGVEIPLVYGKDGKCVIGANSSGDILSVLYDDCVEEFRKVVEFCGIITHAPAYAAVYADNRIYSVFANKDISFTLCPEKSKTLYNMITGEKIESQTEITLKAKEGIAFEILEK